MKHVISDTFGCLLLQARNVWCVTGTPFPRGDDSVWGINQMLRVNIKFVISNNPFTMGKVALSFPTLLPKDAQPHRTQHTEISLLI